MDGWKLVKFLRGKWALWALLFCLCPHISLVHAQESDQELSEHNGLEVRFSKLWQRYQTAKRAGDENTAKILVKEMKETVTAATPIYELGGYLFLCEGYSELAAGNSQAAREEFRNAYAMNPYLWPAYEGLGQLKRSESFLGGLRLSITGMRDSFNTSNAWFVLDSLDWLLNLLMRVVMILVIVIAAILCSKYTLQFFASSLNSFEERHIHGFFARLLAVTILCLPFLLGFNIFLVACLYLVLFFPFFDGRERLTSILVGVSVLILPILGYFSGNVLWAKVDPALRLHLSQFVRSNRADELRNFEKISNDLEARDLSTLILGQLQKSEGDLRDAIETFASIPKQSPWADYASINNGNIRYLAREYQDALDAYGQVKEDSAVFPLALYNRSVVKSKQGFLEEAESQRSKAVSQDSEVSARAAREGSGRVLDALPDNKALLLQAIFSGDSKGKDFVQRVMPALALVLAFVLLSLLHLRYRNTRLLTKSCDKCGRLYLPSDSPESEWCSQCVTLYMKKDDLPSEAKLRKHDEVTRFSKRRRRMIVALQLVAPGSVKLLGGNAVSGLFTLGLWVLLLNLSLTPINSMANFAMRFLQGPVLLTWIFASMALVFWVIFGLRPLLKES